MTQPLTIFFALLAVVALIGVTAWLVRRFGGSGLGTNTGRGRMPRLAVVDAAAVDGRRKLVLVRRDNIEHLLMIGGPTDIVVEPNIVRAAPARDQLPQRTGIGEPPPRVAPLPDSGWSDDSPRPELDLPEPQMPELPSRPARPSFADEARRPAAERRSDPLATFVPEPLGAPSSGPLGGRPEPRIGSRSEPMMPRPSRPTETPKAPPVRAPERAAAPTTPPPLPPSAPPSADQSLAEMAQRLEAALRRPSNEPAAPPVAPEPSPARPVQSETPPPAKSGFENLEDEMASLLGRSKNPSS